MSAEYTFAALPRTQRGTPLVLGGDPKGKNFLYTNGNSVIIRDIENPAIADVYTEHSCQVNVAKYSPSGFYIASGGKFVLFIKLTNKSSASSRLLNLNCSFGQTVSHSTKLGLTQAGNFRSRV